MTWKGKISAKKAYKNREVCCVCGRFKLYNTGGGLICQNINCSEYISIEDDLAEVDKIRGIKYIKS